MKSLNVLQIIIQETPGRLRGLGVETAAVKPAAAKWSPKEELGHLLDSAVNNHQRIVRVQFQDQLALPGYQQENWVKVHGYQDREWSELINLWAALNQHLLAAAYSVPENAWSN